MPIPDFQTLMLPVLKAAAVGEVRIADLTDQLADAFGLSPDERATLLPSGRQTTLANEIGWAKTYLAKAGLLESRRRGYFNATDRGREILAEHPGRIDITFLSRFPEFEQFRRSTPMNGNYSHVASVVEESSKIPTNYSSQLIKQLKIRYAPIL